MGFNTTVVVLNDALYDIERDPDFGKKLVDAILKCGVGEKNIPVSAFGFCNAATVIESHHADYDVFVKVGGNYGEVVREEKYIIKKKKDLK